MLLTKRILDSNKDKDKLWQEFQELIFQNKKEGL
jgi:hypothetical protein